jgi:hypothetical protein
LSSTSTPDDVALGHFGIPAAFAARTVVLADVAVVVVVVATYEPSVALICRLAHTADGWQVVGSAGLGMPMTVMRPIAEEGVLCFAVSTSAAVSEVRVKVGQEHYIIPIEGGYGALIIGGQSPELSWEMTSYRTADGHEVVGSPPSAHSSMKHLDRAHLAALDDARHFVWAAQRQTERFVIAFHTDVEPRFVPASLDDQRRSSLAFAEAEFLLIAAAQAEKALSLLGGPNLSEDMSQDIRMLRNLHEHWEQHRESFAHPSLPKTKAGKSFANKYPADRPWAFQFGANGHYISVLRLESLWDELEAIDVELGRMRNAALAGTAIPHVVEEENRPPRSMPMPAPGRTLAKSVITQSITIGNP